MPETKADPDATRKLTNTAINALQPGRTLRDDRVPGLSVRAHATGKSFMLYYRTRGGDERRPKIGDANVLSIAQAREIARGMLAQVAAGNDPVKEWEAEREEPTIEDLWARCEKEHWSSGRGWDKEAKRLYTKHVKPRLGGRRVRSIGYDDVYSLHSGMADMPVGANRVLAVIATMLNLAERWGLRDIGTNPTRHARRFKETSRRRFAAPAEIASLGAALDRYATTDPSGVAFLYVMLFTGARPTEILRATPAILERRGDQGVLRIAEGKTGVRDVYLPVQAVAALDRLPANRLSLVGRVTTPKKLWKKIRTECGFPDLWMRDLRRTFATVGLSNGMSLSALGELLGHRSAQSTKVYAKLMEDAAFTATAAVAGRMAEMLAPKKENAPSS